MLYWAFEETVTNVKTVSIPDARILYWKPKSRIWKCKEEIDQNEFEKDSAFCTCYGMMNTYAHWYWEHIEKKKRQRFVEMCVKEWVVKDWWAKPWDTAAAWEKFCFDNRIPCDVYSVQQWGLSIYFLQTYWCHGLMTWFKVTEEYRKDRDDNYILDGDVHGWEVFGWHALFEYRLPNAMPMLRDNYPERRGNNIAVVNKKARFDPKYHYKYSYLAVYW